MDPGIGIDVPYNGEIRYPIKYQEDPAEPAFLCASICHMTEDCTHWGVNYHTHDNWVAHTSDTIYCELKKKVTGKRFNPNFKMSGNRACAQGAIGAGKVCGSKSICAL